MEIMGLGPKPEQLRGYINRHKRDNDGRQCSIPHLQKQGRVWFRALNGRYFVVGDDSSLHVVSEKEIVIQ